MKNLILTAAFILTLGYYATAQVGVGTDTPQATLEVQGDQGMLLPRMADHTVIVPVDGTLSANEKGLLVYNTTVNKIYLWDGTAWSESTDALTANNGLTKTGTNVQLGGALTQNTDITTGNFDLNVEANTLVVQGSTNRVGIGTVAPERKLHTVGGARIDAVDVINRDVRIGFGDQVDADSNLIFYSDTDTDQEARIIRRTGQDGDLEIENRGNGVLSVVNNGSGDVRLGTNNSTDMTITNGGNVGIGTVAPERTLDVSGSIVIGDGVAGSANNRLNFRRNDGFIGGYIAMAQGSNAEIQYGAFSGGGFHTFSTNSGVGTTAEKMRIANNGNVGIGTDAPARTLDVNGEARVRNIPAGVAADEVVTVNTAGDVRKRTAAQIVAAGGGVTNNLATANQTLTENRNITTGNFDLNVDATTLFVDGSANRVGLGTAGPAKTLDVNGDMRVRTIPAGVAADEVVTVNTAGDVRKRTAAEIVAAGGGVTNNLATANQTLTENRNVTLGSFDLNVDANTLFVDGSANRVGLGTNAPIQRLDVNGNARFNTGLVSSTPTVRMYTGDNFNGWFQFEGNNAANGGDILDFRLNTTNATISTRGTQALVLNDAGGRVGIGTAAPVSTLDVRGSLTIGDGVAGGANNRLNFRRNDGAVGGIIAIAQGSNSELQYSATSGGGFHTFTTNSSTGPQEKMRIANNGNVGIGTNAPARPLDVNGQARVRNIPAGATADEVVTVNTSGDVRKRTTQQVVETRVMAGAIFIGDVDDNDNATITTPTALRGFVTSGVENGSCGGGTNDDACITVNFANIGTTNYVVNVTYRTDLTNVSGAPSVDSSGEVMVPVVYDKTATSFKVFVEATSDTQQSLWLDFILMKY